MPTVETIAKILRPLAIAAALLVPRAVLGATINVPADQPTIQAAVDSAGAGDTIVVAPGTYNEAVQVTLRPGLQITGAGIGTTTVLAPGDGPAFTITDCADLRISRMTLSSQNIAGDNASIGGILFIRCRPAHVSKVMVTRHSGNGIVTRASDIYAENVLLVNNGDDGFRMDGSEPGPSSLTAWNCTVAHNRGGSGCGLWMAQTDYYALLFNNIFYNNDYDLAFSGSACDHDYNVIAGGGTNFWGTASRSPNEPGCDPQFVNAPAGGDYHILPSSCAVDAGVATYSGRNAAVDDFEDQPRPIAASWEMGADEVATCFVSLPVPLTDQTICAGGSVTLDASSAVSGGCGAALVWDWTDGAGNTWTSPSIDVAPTADTTYTVTIACMTDRSCAITRSVRVSVHDPPKVIAAGAVDLEPCTLGLRVQWDPAEFHDPSRSGVYNVYRSETDCADALSRPPIASGLTTTSWIDPGTAGGTTYVYVVQAEDARTSTPCASGPHHGGAVDVMCTLPVTEGEEAIPPERVFACLRARHDGDLVTMMWPTVRPLLAGEHFHLLQALDHPTNLFQRINPEADLSTDHSGTDLRSWIQFFDLRVANACEIESPVDYPPGW